MARISSSEVVPRAQYARMSTVASANRSSIRRAVAIAACRSSALRACWPTNAHARASPLSTITRSEESSAPRIASASVSSSSAPSLIAAIRQQAFSNPTAAAAKSSLSP